MKAELLRNLCCPNCRSDISVASISKKTSTEIIDGLLRCQKCGSLFKISEGIPVLLPLNFSNINECELRKKVSESADRALDNWRFLYDAHHFRHLAHRRIRGFLNKNKSLRRQKILDIGIGWGVNYLPFVSDIDLYGIDFSLESLMLLKRIYERENAKLPILLCASLSAIPLKNIKFNLIWSTQVYQHIPDINEISKSFDYLVKDLMENSGSFVVDNLNFNSAQLIYRLKKFFRPHKAEQFEREKLTDTFYLKYYLKNDFDLLLKNYEGIVKYKVHFTENLFHPDLRIHFGSDLIAQADELIRKTIISNFIGRQISLIITRN